MKTKSVKPATQQAEIDAANAAYAKDRLAVQERPGYSIPFILATGGSYKPSDFAKANPQQDDK